ncbi:MAG: DNA-binding protein [Proteobacteria bacterium]|nr:DNA-binding protein [Pseudomonadota bacterium]
MSNFQSDIQTLVEEFVASLTALWRRAATEALAGVDVGGGGGRGARRGSGAAAPATSGGAARRKGEKRTAEDLDKLQDTFLDYVRANPGMRIEQINKALGTSTKDLQLPVRKLIADGAIKGKGEKRSTTYTATGNAKKK